MRMTSGNFANLEIGSRDDVVGDYAKLGKTIIKAGRLREEHSEALGWVVTKQSCNNPSIEG
jgi:hypothetical protein